MASPEFLVFKMCRRGPPDPLQVRILMTWESCSSFYETIICHSTPGHVYQILKYSLHKKKRKPYIIFDTRAPLKMSISNSQST